MAGTGKEGSDAVMTQDDAQPSKGLSKRSLKKKRYKENLKKRKEQLKDRQNEVPIDL